MCWFELNLSALNLNLLVWLGIFLVFHFVQAYRLDHLRQHYQTNI